MSVRIHNLLSLELFKGADIVAGVHGLENEIKRINFTDCPMPEDIMNIGLIERGDLFINSLYVVKEDENKLYDFIKAFIACGCAGTIIITEYIKQLPLKVVDLCNENNFPVIFIVPNIPYAEIIKTTMEMILEDKSDTILELRIEKLFESDVSKKTIVDTAHELNKHFIRYYATIYIKISELENIKKQLLISSIKKATGIEPAKFKDGLFIIFNFDKTSILDSEIIKIESITNRYFENFHIGVSNVFSEIEQFNISLRQALLSMDIANIIDGKTVHYKDINVYKILYPLKGTDTLQDFYNDIMTPLTDYDIHYEKFELVKTIEAYIDNDGDYKKAAMHLNQHENTVRYRILKAKKILNLENNNFKFIEQVSIALKIKNMLDKKM